MEYLEGRTTRTPVIYEADPDAVYESEVVIDLNTLEPTVSLPHLPSNAQTISQVKGTKIDQVVIGSCTNGRISDMRIAASILNGKKVADGIRCIVLPATQDIIRQMIEEGIYQQLLEAGCAISTPTCGPCLGGHMGCMCEGEVAVSTTNRNFVGRMGHVESKVILASPAVAAASAIKGCVADPREL
jgi:3-isopropylmalate/(R)-2-methylmalate dehydratase large subunit